MADFNLFPGRKPLEGISALLYGGQNPQGGLGGFQQIAQDPNAMALAGGAPPVPPPRQVWDEGIPGQIAAMMPQRKPMSQTSRIFGAIGDALSGFGGMPPLFYQAQQRAAQEEAEQRSTLQELILRAKMQQPDEWQYYLNNPGDRPVLDQYNQNKGTNIRFGTDPVTGAFGQFGGATPSSAAPPVGYVWQGKRFKGGDYNNVSNWEDVGGSTVAPSTGFR